MELSERKKHILKAVIDEYMGTSEPVGSRAISKKNELGLSSATIRNEMADLEEMGFLIQPHTSAGRVPSDAAYRFYVNTMLKRYQVSVEMMEKLQHDQKCVVFFYENGVQIGLHGAKQSYGALTGNKIKSLQLYEQSDAAKAFGWYVHESGNDAHADVFVGGRSVELTRK